MGPPLQLKPSMGQAIQRLVYEFTLQEVQIKRFILMDQGSTTHLGNLAIAGPVFDYIASDSLLHSSTSFLLFTCKRFLTKIFHTCYPQLPTPLTIPRGSNSTCLLDSGGFIQRIRATADAANCVYNSGWERMQCAVSLHCFFSWKVKSGLHVLTHWDLCLALTCEPFLAIQPEVLTDKQINPTRTRRCEVRFFKLELRQSGTCID